jgi:2-oxoglutarate ferredoxin oxidoreductase subunit beta
MQAMQTLMEHNGLVTGLIYQNKEKSAYEDMVKGFKPEGLAHQSLEIEEEKFNQLIKAYM